ncbi:hypothetical protein NHX12_025122 [Muraenolepis orangiensis]|uniref:Neurotransmitter-gated ion-channel transmembrane domain-containing protein n=1 Tax=Muraenolepis orangiensis TaxID=630683 RepID=A0A9Q0EPB0_9TELE|nr:hypothetical protein NHX12_025122 [Muraenolepis orangiensis]
MRRRPILYIVNFLLPIGLFLFLDAASLFIPEKSGEKLSFKVTVMLSVTVLQLVLKDILPTTSNKMPLIASYCTSIFSLMFFSILETILMMHLGEKARTSLENEETDSTVEEFEGNKDLPMAHRGNEDKMNGGLCISDGSVETASQVLPVAEEVQPI